MNTDDFEKMLQQQPLKKIPGDWRQDILPTARNAAAAETSRPARSLLQATLTGWRELIRPCRYAWSGLAALWLVLWLINGQLRPADAPRHLKTSTSVMTDRVRFFEEQRRILVELTGPIDFLPAEPPRRTSPKPHSERTLEIRSC